MAGRTLPGTITQGERPVWQPLLDLVGEDLTGWFMWMYEVELADRTPLHAYKHVATRRYLHLSEDGRTFAYRSEARYREIAPRAALREAFADWDRLVPAPPDPEAVRAAIRRARGSCA
jgi:hypothetical protein